MKINLLLQPILTAMMERRRSSIAVRSMGNEQFPSSRREPIDRLIIDIDRNKVVCIYVGGDVCDSWITVEKMMEAVARGSYIPVGNYEGSGPI